MQRLKRWESPRRQGRNDKGKGGSARQRQLKKQQQMLRKKLKPQAKQPNQLGGEENNISSFFNESANVLKVPAGNRSHRIRSLK